jgi:hypothetical protein
MIALLSFVLAVLVAPFGSKGRLEAQNAALRHQLIVLRRKMHGRVRLTNNDRLFFILLYRWFPSVLKALIIIRPQTIVRWHQAGFRRYWRWKSRSLGGRPRIDTGLRALIRKMSIDNPLWGAPRIHGELLKLGFRSPSRALPSTWSSGLDRLARDGVPSCVITRRTSPPWTCSLSRPLASTCSGRVAISQNKAKWLLPCALRIWLPESLKYHYSSHPFGSHLGNVGRPYGGGRCRP